MSTAHKQEGAIFIFLSVMVLGIFGVVSVFAQEQKNATPPPAIVEAPSDAPPAPEEPPSPPVQPGATLAELGASAGLDKEVVRDNRDSASRPEHRGNRKGGSGTSALK